MTPHLGRKEESGEEDDDRKIDLGIFHSKGSKSLSQEDFDLKSSSVEILYQEGKNEGLYENSIAQIELPVKQLEEPK